MLYMILSVPQSHLCEQLGEITYTLGLFPSYQSITQILDDMDLLTEKVTIYITTLAV